MVDLQKLYQQVRDMERMAAELAAGGMPSSPSATHSGRSSGGSSTTSSGGGGGGGGGPLRGVTVGGRALHQQSFGGGAGGGGGGQDWQAGLLQYSDGDSPGGRAQQPAAAAPADEGQELAPQVRAGAGG